MKTDSQNHNQKSRTRAHIVLPLEIKALGSDGTFNGVANMMEIEDLVGDVIHAGSFAKTLKDRGPMRPLLADHEADLQNRIGAVELRENGNMLEVVKGEFNLDKQAGQDAYADAKFYHERGIAMGLSIGYGIPRGKWEIKDGVRHIYEVALDEVSIVPWPANQESYVTSVKEMSMQTNQTAFRKALETKGWEYTPDTFAERVQALEQYDQWRVWARLREVLESVMYDTLYSDMTAEEKNSAMQDAFSEYSALALDWFGAMVTAQDGNQKAAPGPQEIKALLQEAKAGRVLSTANQRRLEEAMAAMTAIMESLKTDDEEADGKSAGTSNHTTALPATEPGTPTPETKAADMTEPDSDDHSAQPNVLPDDGNAIKSLLELDEVTVRSMVGFQVKDISELMGVDPATLEASVRETASTINTMLEESALRSFARKMAQ